MICLIFSDVHGNLPALESVLKKEKDIDLYINLGDVVNYGPWSNECVKLVDSLNCLNILGNHEQYFIDGVCNVNNDIVKAFFHINYEHFHFDSIINKYHKEIIFNNYLLTHNLVGKAYVFHDTQVQIKQNIMIGHSHQQYIRSINKYSLINPGSVGQNRSNIEFSNYLIWDTDKDKFYKKELKVNIDLMVKEFKIRKYPDYCINYYLNKIK